MSCVLAFIDPDCKKINDRTRAQNLQTNPTSNKNNYI